MATRTSSKRDVIAVVERAYDLGGSDREWLTGLVAAARPLIEEGLGAVGYLYRAPWGATMEVSEIVGAGAAPALLTRFPEFTRAVPVEMVERTLRARTGCATASEMLGLGAALPDYPPWRAGLQPLGMLDALATNVMVDPGGRGCLIGAALPAVRSTPSSARRLWDRLAAHIAAGLRLRDELGGAPALEGAEAVLSPSGRLEHAEASAQPAPARERLRAAALAVERARGRLRTRDPDDALELWRGLVDGRWSLVDHFERGGRRYLVARKNDPGVRDPRHLGQRERQVVWYASLGHGNKIIAYELGVSLSSVATHLRRASAKLGVGSRAELIAMVRSLTGGRS